ncbi:MAG: hypothetical protein COX62_08950 [Deltaproteobacteria bacterium CG_4_10_14_0_2_um_filter_43_8]|nr:MAG: hypothetical protein COV43_00240 [Deltaproteobacteria bacterium CG11_big_fil_rev_8_21_14_0_20_42_23]PJA18256.1 MAG: hypothetical protein COX62_08950 [Deltaproteobacteria bacterium CG_4_10_14_0_2_um_filter_43_8]PJC64447.1 MAG: hypothetical protein CO021_04145 [Deltaproteobacteria bacterium CG_4_9_14_0_2_um_filter_42_21]
MNELCHHISTNIPLTLFAFFLLGLGGSLHCLGMCGPLSALFIGPQQNRNTFILASYHFARLLSYALAGAVLNVFGQGLQQFFVHLPLKWLVVIPLALYAFGLQLKAPRFVSRLQLSLLKHPLFASAQARAMLLGSFSPLLPCGLLYAALASSLLASSALQAAILMASFALGTIPLLALGQAGQYSLHKKLDPHKYRLGLRLAAVFAIGVLLGLGRLLPGF